MKRLLSIVLSIVMMQFILSLPVLAETNHGGSDAGGETGKGSSDWKFTTNGRGIRIGIYFVEGKKEDFANPDAEIYQIGDPTDFAKAGIPSNYTVQIYTRTSVFDYMKKKKEYNPIDTDEDPYTYVHPTESVVKSMPEPFEATREQWHQWFEGNNYKNIPEITKLCGEEISSEDFSKGIYREPVNNTVLHGTYKIFFEPLISAIVDGNAMFLTLRDAIKYNEERNNEQDYNNTIVWKLNLMFEYLANPAYLIIDEEEALNMYANSGEYKVEYIRSKYNESCTEIIDEMKPGGRIYNSMGVGVVCKEYEVPPEPVIVEEPEPEVPEIPIASVTEEVTGALKAEDRDTGELYDVDKGIPSTEKLYANIISNEYLKDFDFELVQGSRDYTVKVKRTYYLHYQDWFPNSDDCSNCTGGRVDDPDDPDPAKTIPCGNCNGDGLVSGYDWTYDTYDYSATYPITRHYQYWNITELGIYEIENAEVTNDALDGDKATIAVDQAKYNKPVINEFKHDPDIDYHVLNDPMADAVANGSISVVGSEYVLQLGPKDITPTGDDTIKPSVGSPDFSGDVKNAVGNFKVRNDTLVFNGQTIMSGAIDDDGIAEPPTDIPMAPMTGKNVLYEKGLEIPAEIPNGTYATNAAVKYRLLEDSLNPPRGDEVILTGELNPVTVHTPVVCNSGVREEYARSQQLGPKESERMELILGRDSMIKFQTEAYMHRDIKGYGDRDYTKYVKAKYVRFPFDIYIKNVSGGWDYVPKDSWHEVDKSQEYADIRVPVWVDEGEYTVNFKTIAINAPEDIDDPGDADFSKAPGDTGSMQEYMANKDMANYVACRDSKVRVVGRVENFRITDINDYPLWEKVFRTKTGSSSHTGKSYSVGSASEIYDLPIMDGSHPTQGDRGALKTGYAFKFTIDTVGEYFEDEDYIRIVPTFYYVGKNGGSASLVDIYYNEYFNGKDNILVRIGSDKDKTNRQVIVNTDIYRNMPEADIQRTCELRGITDKKFKGRKADIGTYGEIKLSRDLKLFIGDAVSHPFAAGSAEADRVAKSVQRWYGEYKLPDKLYVAPAGTDIANHPESQNGIDGRESFWLKDGCIIVNFRIETYHTDDTGAITGPVLGYWHGNYNRWEAEGFEYVQDDHYGNTFYLDDGDVVFYHAAKKSSDDYKVGGNR